MQEHQLSNGFIFAAAVHSRYALAACMSAASIKDYFPEANITLFATADVIDGLDTSIFDRVVTEGVPNDKRAKLWALSKTPYTRTAYIDADTLIHTDEIANIFDQLGDNDIIFTKIRKYNSNLNGFIEDPEYIRHGGIFVYNNSPDTIEFMSNWWNMWIESRADGQFVLKYPEYPARMGNWDQFFLFYLVKHTPHGLKLGFFEEDARWNFVAGYREEELNGKPAIIEHYTLNL